MAVSESGGGDGRSASGSSRDSAPASPSQPTTSPQYSNDGGGNTPTLAEAYASYYSSIGTGSLGGLMPNEEYYNMDGSAQPLAPQAPGNVLYGSFGNAMKSRGTWIAGALILAVVIWYFWRKRSSA